jgi:senataxin
MTEFSDILKCLILLLKRMGSGLWEGEQLKYPEVTFDSIKDNQSYLDLLQNSTPSDERPWFFAWFSEYLHTISGSMVYGDVLAKMVGFMCEELQHERFKDARPAVMVSATRVSDPHL